MNLEVKKNHIYLVHKFAYRPENCQVLILDDFDEACAEYVETMKLMKSSVEDKDYMEGFISVIMNKVRLFEKEFGQIHGWKPEVSRVEEAEIFRRVKHLINIPKKREIAT